MTKPSTTSFCGNKPNLGDLYAAKYWTIKEFSKLTGVTVRTLQYYDEEGILQPHHKSDAGYRSYSEQELLCLQKINILKYIANSKMKCDTLSK